MSTRGVVSFLADPTTRVQTGAQFVAYLKAMGATHVKAPIRTAASGALPTGLYVQATTTHTRAGIQVLPLFDRAFRPVGGESAAMFPNMPLNAAGDRLTSPWIDGWTLRATGFLRQMHNQCGIGRAIAWNEADLLSENLPQGRDPDPMGEKANALNPAVYAALCWQAARRWKSVGIASVYCGGLSVLPQSGLDDRSPYIYGYLDAAYKSLEAYGCKAPWPWAGVVANCNGWWGIQRFADAVAEIRKVMTKHGDTGQIIIGEWLSTNQDYRDHPASLAITDAAMAATGLERYAFQAPGKVPNLGPVEEYTAEGLYQWRNAGGQFIAGPDYSLGPPVRALFKAT